MRNKKLYTELMKRYRPLLQEQKFSEAQQVLDEMKSMFPSNAWYNEGLLIGTRAYYEKTGAKTVPQQLACFKKSLEYNPKYESAWRSVGTCYMALEQYDKAEDAFQKSLVHARNDIFRGDAYRYLSDVALKRGDTEEALRFLNQILKLKKRPPYLQIANHFIKYYQNLGNQQKVNEWAKKGIMSARMVEKSGKQAYGSNDAYKKIAEQYQAYIK